MEIKYICTYWGCEQLSAKEFLNQVVQNGYTGVEINFPDDANFISESEKEKLKGMDVLVLNALRREAHISHFTLDEAVALAKELGAKNIRVNSVCPGMISTGFHDQFTQSDVRSKVAAATALKREGTADEVGQLVAFLMSREASFMTGNCIDINGGLLFS